MSTWAPALASAAVTVLVLALPGLLVGALAACAAWCPPERRRRCRPRW